MDLPPEVQVVRAKGRTYYYWAPNRGARQRGDRQALPRDPTDPAFWAAIKAFGGTNPNVPVGSVADLIQRYRVSRDFLDLAASTQSTYGVHLDRFADPERWGLLPARNLTPLACQTQRDAMTKTPVMANQMLAVGRAVWDWGIPLGVVRENPFDKVKDLRVPERGHIPWPDWARSYVLEEAPDDLVRFVPVHRERNGLWCRPQKTNRVRRAFFIPLGAAEALEIDRWAETPVAFTASRWAAPIERHHEGLYLYTPRGQPYTPERIRARWGRWLATPVGTVLVHRWRSWLADQVKRYGWHIEPEDSRGPTLHGLRGAAVLIRRKAGYEAQAIANDIGMSLPMVMRYTRFMDQMEVAEANRRRFEVVQK